MKKTFDLVETVDENFETVFYNNNLYDKCIKRQEFKLHCFCNN